MAKLEIDGGWFGVGNKIEEALGLLAGKLPSRHYGVFIALRRAIDGWGKTSDRISAGYLAKRTGLERKHVTEVLADLERWQMILIERAGPRRRSTLSIQQLVERWNVGETRHAVRVRASAPAERGRSSAPAERGNLPLQSGADLPPQSGALQRQNTNLRRQAEFAVAFPDRSRERKAPKRTASSLTAEERSALAQLEDQRVKRDAERQASGPSLSEMSPEARAYLDRYCVYGNAHGRPS